MLTIALKRKHFRKHTFGDNENCPIALALKERYNTNDVYVYTYAARVGNQHRDLQETYDSIDYREDRGKAQKKGSPEQIIRKVVFV